MFGWSSIILASECASSRCAYVSTGRTVPRVARALLLKLPYVVGVLLLASSMLKIFGTFTGSTDIGRDPVGFAAIVGGTCIEILLVVWIITDGAGLRSNIGTIVFFAVVSCVAANEWFHSERSCGCFGSLLVPPYITTIFDIIIFCLLSLRVVAMRGLGPPAGRTRSAIIIGFGVSLAATFSILAYLRYTSATVTVGMVKSGSVIVLRPDEWMNRPLPLLPYIKSEKPIDRGQCRVVLLHTDCSECARALPGIEEAAKSRAERTVLIEVPSPTSERSSIIPSSAFCEVAYLDASYEWFVKTPVVIDLWDGQVVTEASGSRAAQ